MKTLEQQLQEKLIDEIFPSFSEEHRKHLNLMIREIVKEWLGQKEEEYKRLISKHPETAWTFGDGLEWLLEEFKKC